MNSNIGRELIIRVIIKDDEKSKWIWQNHLDNDYSNGVDVREIAEGNYYSIQEKYNDVEIN